MNRPISEQDEFLLSRLVDDDLPADQADALRARLDREPDLQRVYRRLLRLDSLLSARRADQPDIDWARFHRQVMQQVANEAPPAVPVVYKLRNYLRVAVPLVAAAATITLIVWFYPRSQKPVPAPAPLPGGIAKDTTQRPTDPPHMNESTTTLVVQYYRLETDDSERSVAVSFARSEELSKTIEKEDRDRNVKPSGAILASALQRPKSSVPRAVVVAAASLVY